MFPFCYPVYLALCLKKHERFFGHLCARSDTNFGPERYLPGHIHAFYLEYVYYDRREQAREGRFAAARAPGVYSDHVQSGGQGYGTIVQPAT